MTNNYLESAKSLLDNYKKNGEKTFDQLSDEQLHWQYNEDSNSIAMLINHLWGNMMSRWTDFLTTDGEKEWRRRDAEFAVNRESRGQLMAKWNEGWQCVFNALNGLGADDLDKTITIRGIKHSVTEAINRSVTHYISHIGQIMYIGKMLRGSEWISLSIPRKK